MGSYRGSDGEECSGLQTTSSREELLQKLHLVRNVKIETEAPELPPKRGFFFRMQRMNDAAHARRSKS